MQRRRRLALLGAGALLAAGCATNPVTGRQEISLVSSAQEDQIGRDAYPAVLAEYGAYDENGIQAYVDSVGQKLARVSHLPGLTWHFTVLDDPAVNAFAMPGGYIYITRGILAYLNSEAQLAGVLGHEIGHVTHRHTAEQITKQQLYGLGFGVASILSDQVRKLGDVAQQGLGLLFLKYSRDNENQADELGVEYATRAGYDPREIPSTYAVLKRISDVSGQSIPSFLSTHPDPGDREAHTTALANAAAAGKSGLLIRSRAFVQRLEGVVYGNDPRQGYFEGERFFHPSLGFQMSFPAGWTYQNSRSSVVAASSDRSAALQLTLASAGALSPSAYVDQLLRTGKISAQTGARENIGGFEAWVGRVSVAQQGATPVTLVAVWIRRSPDQMFQILGQVGANGSADERTVLASARSYSSLTDRTRLSPVPERLRVVAVSRSGPLPSVLASLGAQAITPAETSVLNNLQPDETVQSGQLLKIVVPGRTR